MKMKMLLMVLAGVMISFCGVNAFAAGSATVDVTVSIAQSIDFTLDAGGPITLGVQTVGSQLYAGAPIKVTNTGTGPQTYYLSMTAPAGWTSVTGTPGVDQFRMDAAFDADGTLTWGTANAMTTTAVAASVSQFAGDATGNNIARNIQSKIWVRLVLPTSVTTSGSGAKTIVMTITAAAA